MMLSRLAKRLRITSKFYRAIELVGIYHVQYNLRVLIDFYPFNLNCAIYFLCKRLCLVDGHL